MSGGKGNTAHFVWRCGFCRRESSAKFEPASPVQAYTVESSGKFAPFVTLDCRGLEFTGFEPRVLGFFPVCYGVLKLKMFTAGYLEM